MSLHWRKRKQEKYLEKRELLIYGERYLIIYGGKECKYHF